MKNNNDYYLLVIYIGVLGIRSEDIADYTNKILSRISPIVKGQIISIPVNSVDSRIECINPIYITDKELINNNNSLMKELNEHLKHQLDMIKNKENEEN